MVEHAIVVEAVAVRGDCQYLVLEEEPKVGRWWAVQLIPVEMPPDPRVEIAVDGPEAPVEQFAVIAVEKQLEDGKWIWVTLTPAAKRLFGDLLFNNKMKPSTWFYIYEFDKKVAAAADAEEDVEVSQ